MNRARHRFIFITPCVGEEFFVPVRKGAADAAAMMDVDWEFIGTEDVDVPEQIEMVQRAVDEGYHGIALSIIDAARFADPVRAALGAGVPVVAFNVDDRSAPNPRLAAVCQDLREAGRGLGHRILGALDPGCAVLMTAHSEGISALEDRLAGMREVVETKNIRSQVVVTGIEPKGAADIIARVLDDDREIRAVLASGQADTEGAGLAASGLDRKVYVAGFDLSQEILRMVCEGVIEFTIDQQPYIQGFYPVVQLALYCRYGIVPSDIDTGAAFITKENAEEVLELCSQHYR